MAVTDLTLLPASLEDSSRFQGRYFFMQQLIYLQSARSVKELSTCYDYIAVTVAERCKIKYQMHDIYY